MKKLYTWQDIEVAVEMERGHWPDLWKKVEVYNDEIIVMKEKIIDDIECDKKFFTQVFGSFYDAETHTVHIDEFAVNLPIIDEKDDLENAPMEAMPLFKSVYFNKQIELPEEKQDLPGSPVIAFHSYKGGVGRTLILTSLLKEISSLYGNDKKVLVIDFDLEAPGLTWAVGKSSQFPVSYLDVLSMIRVYGAEKTVIDKIAEMMEQNLIHIETEKERVVHYFLPAYLEESQLITAYVRPEHILGVSEERFLISETISALGAALGVDLVLVDLRAGISEISAPLLFDSRVDKCFVSSTSLQSIVGTRMIQEQVYQKTGMGLSHSKIVINMIPQEMSEDMRIQKVDELVQIPERYLDDKDATFLRDEYVIDIDFESQLLYQGRFEEICDVLTGTSMCKKMHEMARGLFKTKPDKKTGGAGLKEQDVREGLERLNENAEITAEAGNASEMLLTDALMEIINGNRKEIPNIVVLGAKGSGKTYLYRQLIRKKTWGNFVRTLEGDRQTGEYIDAAVVPVFATTNDKNIIVDIMECFTDVDRYLGEDLVSRERFGEFRRAVSNALCEKRTPSEWADIWKKQILGLFSGRFQSFWELNAWLRERDKKLIFMIDGLDDLQNYEQGQVRNSLVAVQTLCQNVIKELDYMNHRHIGLLIFVRRDIAEEAIRNNFRQFRDQYGRYELNWSQTEALRLALWVAGKSIPRLVSEKEILRLSREGIEKRLELLWGKKLGKDTSKEANSARWILAALSDFNGQLQARDIVRFLKYASQDAKSVPLQFKDRYIMPKKIREAIEPCAKDKLKEIEQEMPKIYEILQKITDESLPEKILPLELEKISVTVDEVDRLERQGFIKLSEKKYYLPEIIRQALGFRYKVGARPKVLSLLIK